MSGLDRDTAEFYDRLYGAATELILPFVGHELAGPPADGAGREILEQGCGMLDRVLQMDPRNWAAMWFRGIAHKALREFAAAYADFRAAYEIPKDDEGAVESGRQLAELCIALGKGEEAVAITSEVIALQPDDPGLKANHALALLIAGRVAEAGEFVEAARRLTPTDEITLNLARIVADVRSGVVSRPTRWPPV